MFVHLCLQGSVPLVSCLCVFFTARLAGLAQGVKIFLPSGEGGGTMPSLCLQGQFTRSDKSRIILFKAS